MDKNLELGQKIWYMDDGIINCGVIHTIQHMAASTIHNQRRNYRKTRYIVGHAFMGPELTAGKCFPSKQALLDHLSEACEE